jgi:hypothetical protein
VAISELISPIIFFHVLLVSSIRSACPVLDFLILRALSDLYKPFIYYLLAYNSLYSMLMSKHFPQQCALLMLILKITQNAHIQTKKKSTLLTSTVFWVVTPYCPTFRRNVPPPSSGPKSKPSKQTSKQEASTSAC